MLERSLRKGVSGWWVEGREGEVLMERLFAFVGGHCDGLGWIG